MDPISQAALGAVVAQSVAHHKLGYRAAGIGALVGAMPDIDVFFSIGGDYFDQLVWHRGITHSLIFAPVIGPLIAWLVWRWEARASPAPADRKRLLAWVAAIVAAIFSHPLLDLLTTYGTQLLLPFSDARFAINAMPIIDPAYTLTLLGGLLIAGRFYRTNARGVALFTLSISSAYLGYGWYLNDSAEAFVAEQLARENVHDAKIAAFPTIFQVHYRRVVVRTETEDRVGFVSMWKPCEIDWTSASRADSRLTADFERSREGGIFKWFAMGWLHYELNPTDTGYQLSAIDLRYGASDNPRESMFMSRAQLDSQGSLLSAPTSGGFRPSADQGSIRRLFDEIYSPSCAQR
ncbi:MAG: metal-dependent hydrolase [Gammaproteobacteria bacterium]|nr:metal-dependent hydrolase [Gammaproteobacteria bacterium]MCZ6856262.1 metal-dependent hydrolase [Gammaproteobacteria bacterium]